MHIDINICWHLLLLFKNWKNKNQNRSKTWRWRTRASIRWVAICWPARRLWRRSWRTEDLAGPAPNRRRWSQSLPSAISRYPWEAESRPHPPHLATVTGGRRAVADPPTRPGSVASALLTRRWRSRKKLRLSRNRRNPRRKLVKSRRNRKRSLPRFAIPRRRITTRKSASLRLPVKPLRKRREAQ